MPAYIAYICYIVIIRWLKMYYFDYIFTTRGYKLVI